MQSQKCEQNFSILVQIGYEMMSAGNCGRKKKNIYIYNMVKGEWQ
jgi:hypothetical protein